jgi:hypothetical protein
MRERIVRHKGTMNSADGSACAAKGIHTDSRRCLGLCPSGEQSLLSDSTMETVLVHETIEQQ